MLVGLCSEDAWETRTFNFNWPGSTAVMVRTSQIFFRFRIVHNYINNNNNTRILYSMMNNWKASFVELVLWHYRLSSAKYSAVTQSGREISKINSNKGFCLWQNITIKIIQLYQKQLFLHQNKEYNTRVVARIQRGDPRLRQFTFNNRCVRLFIYSPLFHSSLLSSVCLIWFLSLKKKGVLAGR